MKIVLCDDDDERFLKQLGENIKIICDELNENLSIVNFASGDEFLKYYEIEKNIDIIFLDILMDGINGIQVAKEIRNKDNKMQIFFLTSIKNYVFEGYNLRAVNYLLKPISYNNLKKEISKAINNIRTYTDKYIVERNDSGVYKVYIDDILFVETFLRNTQIHTCQEKVLSYKSMKKHYEIFEPEDFFRIHESYIVNLAYITKVKGYEVNLTNGMRLPVSKNRKKAFMERLAIYYGKLV